MSQKTYYFDYMSTTPVDERVLDKMILFMGKEGAFGNPASVNHVYGQEALRAVEEARQEVAQVIGALAEEVIFTSGATEANHLALLGAARMYQRKGKHLITMSTEHPAVLGPMELLSREGFEVTYLSPEADGLLDLDKLKAAIRPDTILVSIMQVNNETGVIQDISAIGTMLEDKGILFHVDAAQSIGKVAVDVQQLGIHLLSMSAHKCYGPKGVGALYVRAKPRVRLIPQSIGGGQERALRPGTVPTHQVVGMGAAMKLSEQCREEEVARILKLRERLWTGIQALPGVRLNGHSSRRVAHNLNISIAGISGDSLMPFLSNLAVSSASACAAASSSGSHVLKAMGVSDALALSAIRFSLGRYTNEYEVDAAVKALGELTPSRRTL